MCAMAEGQTWIESHKGGKFRFPVKKEPTLTELVKTDPLAAWDKVMEMPKFQANTPDVSREVAASFINKYGPADKTQRDIFTRAVWDKLGSKLRQQIEAKGQGYVEELLQENPAGITLPTDTQARPLASLEGSALSPAQVSEELRKAGLQSTKTVGDHIAHKVMQPAGDVVLGVTSRAVATAVDAAKGFLHGLERIGTGQTSLSPIAMPHTQEVVKPAPVIETPPVMEKLYTGGENIFAQQAKDFDYQLRMRNPNPTLTDTLIESAAALAPSLGIYHMVGSLAAFTAAPKWLQSMITFAGGNAILAPEGSRWASAKHGAVVMALPIWAISNMRFVDIVNRRTAILDNLAHRTMTGLYGGVEAKLSGGDRNAVISAATIWAGLGGSRKRPPLSETPPGLAPEAPIPEAKAKGFKLETIKKWEARRDKRMALAEDFKRRALELLKEDVKRLPGVEEPQGLKVYRGGDKPLDNTKGANQGISVTTDAEAAKNFGDTVSEAILPATAKVLRDPDIPQELKQHYLGLAQKLAAEAITMSEAGFTALRQRVLQAQQAIVSFARSAGYDAVEFPFENEIRIIRPGILELPGAQVVDISPVGPESRVKQELLQEEARKAGFSKSLSENLLTLPEEVAKETFESQVMTPAVMKEVRRVARMWRLNRNDQKEIWESLFPDPNDKTPMAEKGRIFADHVNRNGMDLYMAFHAPTVQKLLKEKELPVDSGNPDMDKIAQHVKAWKQALQQFDLFDIVDKNPEAMKLFTLSNLRDITNSMYSIQDKTGAPLGYAWTKLSRVLSAEDWERTKMVEALFEGTGFKPRKFFSDNRLDREAYDYLVSKGKNRGTLSDDEVVVIDRIAETYRGFERVVKNKLFTDWLADPETLPSKATKEMMLELKVKYEDMGKAQPGSPEYDKAVAEFNRALDAADFGVVHTDAGYTPLRPHSADSFDLGRLLVRGSRKVDESHLKPRASKKIPPYDPNNPTFPALLKYMESMYRLVHVKPALDDLTNILRELNIPLSGTGFEQVLASAAGKPMSSVGPGKSGRLQKLAKGTVSWMMAVRTAGDMPRFVVRDWFTTITNRVSMQNLTDPLTWKNIWRSWAGAGKVLNDPVANEEFRRELNQFSAFMRYVGLDQTDGNKALAPLQEAMHFFGQVYPMQDVFMRARVMSQMFADLKGAMERYQTSKAAGKPNAVDDLYKVFKQAGILSHGPAFAEEAMSMLAKGDFHGFALESARRMSNAVYYNYHGYEQPPMMQMKYSFWDISFPLWVFPRSTGQSIYEYGVKPFIEFDRATRGGKTPTFLVEERMINAAAWNFKFFLGAQLANAMGQKLFGLRPSYGLHTLLYTPQNPAQAFVVELADMFSSYAMGNDSAFEALPGLLENAAESIIPYYLTAQHAYSAFRGTRPQNVTAEGLYLVPPRDKMLSDLFRAAKDAYNKRYGKVPPRSRRKAIALDAWEFINRVVFGGEYKVGKEVVVEDYLKFVDANNEGRGVEKAEENLNTSLRHYPVPVIPEDKLERGEVSPAHIPRRAEYMGDLTNRGNLQDLVEELGRLELKSKERPDQMTEGDTRRLHSLQRFKLKVDRYQSGINRVEKVRGFGSMPLLRQKIDELATRLRENK